MRSIPVIFVIISALAIVHCAVDVPKFSSEWFLSLNKQSPPKPPQTPLPRLILERWFSTKVDHFGDSDATWNMRYFSNDAHYVPGGPLFIFVGGEYEISYNWMVAGHLFDMAEEMNGILFHAEHRYYGQSHPTADVSTENLRFLTSDQAMEDLAQFIQYQRETLRGARNSKVILAGVSYAGSLVTWFSERYPNLVDFAWASSAPIHAQVDLPEYREVVATSIQTFGGDTCHNFILETFTEMEGAVDNGNADLVMTTFNLCNSLTNSLDTWTFFTGASNMMSAVAQIPEFMATLCELFPLLPFESSMETYANLFFNTAGECTDARYITVRLAMGESEWDSEVVEAGARQWFYQTCNEFGWFQTTNSEAQPFGSKIPLELYIQMCMDFFDSHFDRDAIFANIEATNEAKKSFEPDVYNVFSTHGEYDPWRPMGIKNEVNETSPIVVLSGLSHAGDLYSISEFDTPQLRETKERIRNHIRQVLGY